MSCQRTPRTLVYVALATAPLLFAFDPAETWWFPSCPLRALTGWLCPFCGSLRALHALLHGAPGVALIMNPLATIGVLGGLATLIYDALDPTRSSRLEGWIGFYFSARGLALLIAFAVLRNVPFGWMAQ